jgi:hypothetical protein
VLRLRPCFIADELVVSGGAGAELQHHVQADARHG